MTPHSRIWIDTSILEFELNWPQHSRIWIELTPIPELNWPQHSRIWIDTINLEFELNWPQHSRIWIELTPAFQNLNWIDPSIPEFELNWPQHSRIWIELTPAFQNLNWNDKKRILQNYNLKKFNACDAFWEINLQTLILFNPCATFFFFVISEVTAKGIKEYIIMEYIYIHTYIRGGNRHWFHDSIRLRLSCQQFDSIRYHDASQLLPFDYLHLCI